MTASNRSTSVSALLSKKALTLGELLGQIRRELEERSDISEELKREIQQQHARARDQLLPLITRPLSWDRSFDETRQVLEQRIARLEEEDREERAQRWQDVARLRTEARQWIKEYHDLLLRLGMVTQHEQETTNDKAASVVDQRLPRNRARRVGEGPYYPADSKAPYR